MVGVKMGIDFGSANVTVFVEGKGIVFREPSVVICDASTGKPLVIGREARRMLGKLPPSMYPLFPIRDGVVNNFGAAKMMLTRYIDKVAGKKLFRPSVLLCVPSTVNELAKKSLFNLMMEAGAGRVCFVGEALAAYTVRGGMQFVDVLRIIVRILIMPFISMVGSENRDGLLLVERLSPVIVLLPALAYGTGYLQGRSERTKIHTGIAENRKSRARKEKRARKARVARPKGPKQLN